MNIYSWWYGIAFALLKLTQAAVSLATLTLYRPQWTVALARWYSHRRFYSQF